MAGLFNAYLFMLLSNFDRDLISSLRLAFFHCLVILVVVCFEGLMLIAQ